MAILTPQDGEDMVFIPGTDRFAALLPHNRQYRGHGLKSLIVQETDRVASAPIIAPNEKDRLYDGGLKSSDFQDQEKDPVALPSYVADREAKNVKLPQQSDAMDKVLKCPAPPPSYEGLPNGTFSYGATWNILPNARGSPPKLAIAHKFEPPNNIHLRIQIQNCAYRVSELEFKINFCNGDQEIRIGDYHPKNEKSEHTKEIRKVKKNVIANVGNAPLAPLVGGVRQEIGEEYDKIKESYIEIDGLPENDHLISWVWCTVGDSESVGPLKTITVTASIMIPKDTKISQLTATFEGRAKCLARNSTFLGNIGHFFGGETAELRRKDFTVHFEDSAR